MFRSAGKYFVSNFSSKTSDKTETHSTIIEAMYIPAPIPSPMADAAQIVAAEVNPRILSPWRRIAPHPKKPIPETTGAARRAESPP